MIASVGAAALKAMLNDGGEIAVLDVREEGAFALGHLVLASSSPLSRLELGIRDLVPRPSARVVLCDDGEGLAGRAATRLLELGYSDVSTLEGGLATWREAGYVLFTGVNVPSKAFGEVVETARATPHISAEDLKTMLDADEDVIVLDSRPMTEFSNMCIPGAVDVPGAELVYRIRDLAPSPDTLVVVNCAGRTRSIIGAQSLINAGLENRVVALENGTMGWRLAGLDLERGASRRAPEVSGAGLEWGRAAAARVAARFGVKAIGREMLEHWRAESGRRSLYLFDVRSPEEFEAGHLAGSRPAPGGQLVQATDTFIGTRGARVVLVDDTGVRAVMTASWLLQMGWRDVVVLDGGIGLDDLVSGAHVPETLGLDDALVPTISASELARALDRAEAVVIDLAPSRDFEEGHIPGAWFAIRARLDAALSRVPEAPLLVLTSGDGMLARLAALEAAAARAGSVRVLEGGTRAWRAEGLALESGLENLADTADDRFLRPYDRDHGIESAMRDYLTWEIGLVEQIEADGNLRFAIAEP